MFTKEIQDKKVNPGLNVQERRKEQREAMNKQKKQEDKKSQ